MKLYAILAMLGSKKNTIIKLGKLTAVSLNMHQNILPSCHKYVT